MDLITRLLVPLDGTPEAASALWPARVLARATGAELLLVRVVAGYAADAPRTVAAMEYLDAIADELATADLPVRTVVARGDPPAAALLGEIQLHHPDLVVMATRGRAGFRRAVLGSVTQALVAQSPVPVLLVRPGGRLAPSFSTLLVPVDGSPSAGAALVTARALARTFDACVVVLRVVPRIDLYLGHTDLGPAREQEETHAQAQASVDRLVRALEHAGVAAVGRVEDGQPAPTIGAVAEQVAADLVIMATHGRTGPRRALLGSVADAVVRTAGRPVLLLRWSEHGALAPSGALGHRPGEMSRNAAPNAVGSARDGFR